MKTKFTKLISLVCALALVLGIAILPTAVNADSVVELTPSFLHKTTSSEVDGTEVYTTNTWDAGSITFDYQIEAEYNYYISFDYMGKANGYDQSPMFSTVVSSTDKLNDLATNPVALNLPESTSEFKNVWCEVSGEELLASGGSYLIINWKHLTAVSQFKNFKIYKTEKSDIVPKASYLHRISAGFEENEVVYSGQTWTACSLTFDYEIESGYTYYLSFDFTGHNYFEAQKFRASTVATPTTSLNSAITTGVEVSLPSNQNTWYNVSIELDSEDLLSSGGKYLALNFIHASSVNKFKNFKIYRKVTADDGYDYPVTVKRDQVTESIGSNETVYTFKGGAESPSLTFDIEMAAGKTYVISFDYILTGSYSSSSIRPSFAAAETKHGYYDGSSWKTSLCGLSNTSSWKSTTINLKADNVLAGDRTYLMLCAKKIPSSGNLKFRNFIISEYDSSLPFENSNFERGEAGWNDYDSCASVSWDAIEGRRSINLKGGNYSIFGRLITLKSNTNYKISFKYKGTFTGIPNFGISKNGISTEMDSLIHYEGLTTTEDWQTKSTVFATGDDTVFGIVFQTNTGCDFFVDDIRIEETTEASDSVVENSGPQYTETEKDNRFWHWDAKSEDANLVKNGSFDGEGGNWDSLLANGTISLIEHDDAKSGNKVLKFEAHDLEEKSKNYLYVQCEPETEYMLSVWHKGENWSDTNKNDLRWGIADPLSGKMIYTGAKNYVRGWNLNAWDNEWHRTTLKFNSGKNNLIALAYIGGNSVAYIDDLQIFKYDDKVNSRPLVMVQEQPAVVNANPEKLFCTFDKNVFKNSDFKGDIAYWSEENSMGYKGTVSKKYVTVLDWDGIVEVKDTDTVNGSALYYEEQTKYTGQPLSTSYLKYIDVEPETEYTFAADFLIEKAGNGRFGLLSVNDFYPRIISGWQTFGSDYYDSAKNWQTFTFSFNSNEFDRVAFVVQDKGGKAYIDNIRLFKTEDGILEEQKPYTQITSDKYEITDGNIILNEVSVKISDVIKTLNVAEDIRVFDKNGKEITDFSGFVKLGYSFKYMDGPTAFDSVKAEMQGDANGDGLINIRDLVRMKRIISGDIVKGKYLTVFAQNMGGGNSYFKNFKVREVGGEDVSITPVTLKKNEVNILEENGETVYEMLEWKCPSMVFDYELKANKKYIVSFQHKGHNWAQNCVQSFMAAENLDFQVSDILPEYCTSMGLKSNKTQYLSYEVEIDGSYLTAGSGLPEGDFNADGKLNSLDLSTLRIKLLTE